MLLVLQGAHWKGIGTEDRLSSSWGPETLQSDEGAESRGRQYGVMVRGCLVVGLSRQSLGVLTCQVGAPWAVEKAVGVKVCKILAPAEQMLILVWVPQKQSLRPGLSAGSRFGRWCRETLVGEGEVRQGGRQPINVCIKQVTRGHLGLSPSGVPWEPVWRGSLLPQGKIAGFLIHQTWGSQEIVGAEPGSHGHGCFGQVPQRGQRSTLLTSDTGS